MKTLFKALVLIITLVFAFPENSAIAQCTATTVPYAEDFQSITLANQLPACWAASNLGGTCLTFLSPNTAAFSNTSTGPSYFYSRAIQLYSGVTYSTSVFHKNSSNLPWPNLSIGLSTVQNNSNITILASASGINNLAYLSLSNTFSVPVSGQYYMVISATSSGTNSSQFLYWDDLTVTIPCTISSNVPVLNISSTNTAICAGSPSASSIILTAGGANTYSWANGANTTTINANPNTFTYSVAGSSSLTGCSSTATYTFAVLQTPSITIFSNSSIVCSGDTVKLTAIGGTSYSWNNGANTPTLSITPTVSSNYSVVGSNNAGCSNSAQIAVIVNPHPTINISPNTNQPCIGQMITLTATGALTYTWIAQPSSNSSSVNSIISSQTNYSVEGTDINGCKTTSTILVSPIECLGINIIEKGKVIALFPTITTGIVNYTLADLFGQIVLYNSNGIAVRQLSASELSGIWNISDLPQGLYFLKHEYQSKIQTLKIVKIE